MEKKENVKKYKYSVKALAVNGALLKMREILTIYSAQENVASVQNCTEAPELFCAWVLPMPNAHESSKPGYSYIAKKYCQPLSVAFVDHFDDKVTVCAAIMAL